MHTDDWPPTVEEALAGQERLRGRVELAGDPSLFAFREPPPVPVLRDQWSGHPASRHRLSETALRASRAALR